MGTFSDHLLLLCETNLETIRQVIEREHPAVAVIDSIQTMYSEEVTAAPGSVSPVSYTHLDVYKRQTLHVARTIRRRSQRS